METDRKPEFEELTRAALDQAGFAFDTAALTTICANLKTVLALAGTIEDVGYEAAPVFRA